MAGFLLLLCKHFSVSVLDFTVCHMNKAAPCPGDMESLPSHTSQPRNKALPLAILAAEVNLSLLNYEGESLVSRLGSSILLLRPPPSSPLYSYL